MFYLISILTLSTINFFFSRRISAVSLQIEIRLLAILIAIVSFCAMTSSSSSSFINGKKKRYVATRFPYRTSGSHTALRAQAERS